MKTRNLLLRAALNFIHSHRARFLILYLICNFSFPVLAFGATDVLYGTQINKILSDRVNSYTGGWQWWAQNISKWEFSALTGTYASVAYHVRATRLDTGTPLACLSL